VSKARDRSSTPGLFDFGVLFFFGGNVHAGFAARSSSDGVALPRPNGPPRAPGAAANRPQAFPRPFG
jgi:hypothetical protein